MRIYELKYCVHMEKKALMHFQKSRITQFENEAGGKNGIKTKMNAIANFVSLGQF